MGSDSYAFINELAAHEKELFAQFDEAVHRLNVGTTIIAASLNTHDRHWKIVVDAPHLRYAVEHVDFGEATRAARRIYETFFAYTEPCAIPTEGQT